MSNASYVPRFEFSRIIKDKYDESQNDNPDSLFVRPYKYSKIHEVHFHLSDTLNVKGRFSDYCECVDFQNVEYKQYFRTKELEENKGSKTDSLNKKTDQITACILDRDRHKKIIEDLKKLGVKIKLITDGDVSGSLLVTDPKYGIDIFIGTGGGPEGVLSACALDAYNCYFQGRFIFDNKENSQRAQKMGINDLNKKYEISEIISGDSLFCATGITSGDLVKGISKKDHMFISETLVTHKNSNFKRIIKKENIIKT